MSSSVTIKLNSLKNVNVFKNKFNKRQISIPTHQTPIHASVPKVLINDTVCLVPESNNQLNLKKNKIDKDEADCDSNDNKTIEINSISSALNNSEFLPTTINKVLKFPKTMSQEFFSNSLTGLK